MPFNFLSLEQKNLILKILWERSLMGLAIIDEDGKFLKVNDALCTLLEYSEAELQEKTSQEVTHPSDTKSDMEMANRVATKQRRQYDMKKRFITKTGGIVWITLRVQPVFSDGKFEFFLSQISEAVEYAPPRLPTQSKAIKMSFGELIGYAIKNHKKEIAGIMTPILGGLAYFISELIKRLQ